MSGLVVAGFEKTILKSVKIVEKEGKKPLVFVNFVDFHTFNDTGDYIFLKENLTIDEIANLKSLQLKPVKATLTLNEFNGKKSFVITDVVPADVK